MSSPLVLWIGIIATVGILIAVVVMETAHLSLGIGVLLILAVVLGHYRYGVPPPRLAISLMAAFVGLCLLVAWLGN